MNRREIRDHILKLLFIKDFNKYKSVEELSKVYFKYLPYYDDEEEINDDLYVDITTTSLYDFLDSENEVDLNNVYIKEIVDKVNDIIYHKNDLIVLLKNVYNEKEIGWKFNRIMNIDLLILLIATYEMKYQDNIDMEVSINEAVLLGRCYGFDGKGKTINGILREVYEYLKK